MISQTPSRAWIVVAMLWMVALLNYLDRLMITTMRLSLKEVIPMTDAQFGLLTSVFLWVYAVLSPFAGYLADRFNRSRVIVGSLFVWSLLTWLTGQARTFEQLLVARALMGVSEACYIPAALALIADYHRGPTRSLATGIHMTGITAGSALGGVGGWLAERYGWSFGFTLFGIFGAVYATALALTLKDAPRAAVESVRPEKERPTVRLWEGLTGLLGHGPFILLAIYWSILGLAGWAIVGWLPTYLNEQFHLGQGAAGLSATGYLNAAALIGLLVGGGWADRWSRTNARGRILVPVIGLCAAAPAVFLSANTNVLVIAIAGIMIYGFTRGFSDSNMMPILCLVANPRYRATGYGVLNLFGCLVGGITIYAGGALKDMNVNLSSLFQFASGSLLVCALVLFVVKPRRVADVPQREVEVEKT